MIATWREFADQIERRGRIVAVEVERPDPGFDTSDLYGQVPRSGDGWAKIRVQVETRRGLAWVEVELPRTELGDLAEDWRNGRWLPTPDPAAML